MKKLILFTSLTLILPTTYAEDCIPAAIYMRHQIDVQGDKTSNIRPIGQKVAEARGQLIKDIARFNNLINVANQEANQPKNLRPICKIGAIYAQIGKSRTTADIIGKQLNIPVSGKESPPTANSSTIVIHDKDWLMGSLLTLAADPKNKAKINAVGQILFPMMYIFTEPNANGTYNNLNMYLELYTLPGSDKPVCNLNLGKGATVNATKVSIDKLVVAPMDKKLLFDRAITKKGLNCTIP